MTDANATRFVDVIEREEAVIAKGPRLVNLDGYKKSLIKLSEASAELQKTGGPGAVNIPGLAAGQVKSQKDQDEMLARVQSALDSGQKQLGQLAVGVLKDNSVPASESGFSNP